MFRKYRRELTIIIVSLLAILVFGYLIVFSDTSKVGDGLTKLSSRTSSENSDKVEENYAVDTLKLDFAQETPPPLNSANNDGGLFQTGWIPDWDFNNGYDSLKQVTSQMDSVSPVWYYLNPDGSINVNRAGLSQLQQLRTQTGIKVIPSIASFDATEFKNAINTPEKLQNHIEFLKKEVATYELDGLDLDYEAIFLDDQPEYLHLIRSLYQDLDSKGKKLTIAVMPKWGEADLYPGLIQTRKVQNWASIAEFVHEFRIMTYNLTGANSKYPGPIAPMDWMTANLRYAVPRVAPEKLVLGIHLYAYGGWGEQNKKQEPYLGFYTNPYMEEIQAAALTYEGIQERRVEGLISDTIDQATGEKILEYRREGKEYIGYYMDGATVRLRAQLAEYYGAAGLAFWRMGDEDLNVYDRSRD